MNTRNKSLESFQIYQASVTSSIALSFQELSSRRITGMKFWMPRVWVWQKHRSSLEKGYTKRKRPSGTKLTYFSSSYFPLKTKRPRLPEPMRAKQQWKLNRIFLPNFLWSVKHEKSIFRRSSSMSFLQYRCHCFFPMALGEQLVKVNFWLSWSSKGLPSLPYLFFQNLTKKLLLSLISWLLSKR